MLRLASGLSPDARAPRGGRITVIDIEAGCCRVWLHNGGATVDGKVAGCAGCAVVGDPSLLESREQWLSVNAAAQTAQLKLERNKKNNSSSHGRFFGSSCR